MKIRNRSLRIILILVLCLTIAVGLPFAIMYGGNFILTAIKARIWAETIPSYIGRMVSVAELYKQEFGNYPEELADITKKVYSADYLAMGHIMLKLGFGRIFRVEYKLLDDCEAYYFFSRGFDNEPYTDDDLLPVIEGEDLQDFFPGYRSIR